MDDQLRIPAWLVLVLLFLFCVILFGGIAYDSYHLPLSIALPLGALSFFVFLALCLPGFLKSTLLGQLPDEAAFITAREEDFPLLARAEFQRLTLEFIALGFEPVFDCSLHSPTAELNRGFRRWMLHKQHGCFAQIEQSFVGAQAFPISRSLITIYGSIPVGDTSPAVPSHPSSPKPPIPSPQTIAPKSSGPELPWTFTTSDIKIGTLLKLYGVPRLLGDICPKIAPTSELLRLHLKRREEMRALLGETIFMELNGSVINRYFLLVRQAAVRKLQSTNFFIALPIAFFTRMDKPFDAAQQLAMHRAVEKKTKL